MMLLDFQVAFLEPVGGRWVRLGWNAGFLVGCWSVQAVLGNSLGAWELVGLFNSPLTRWGRVGETKQ